MRPSTGHRGEGSLAELAELRAAAYTLLATLFAYPARADLSRLERATRALRRESGLVFQPRLRELLARVAAAAGADVEPLEQEYLGLFVLATAPAGCAPYESAYRERAGGAHGRVAVEVQRAYAAAGVAPADGGELPDHAALELGFLAACCAREQRAWRERAPERAAVWLQRQQEFHELHLQRWFPAFARRLGRVVAEDSLYRALADAARAFVVHDRDLVPLVCERAAAAARARVAA